MSSLMRKLIRQTLETSIRAMAALGACGMGASAWAEVDFNRDIRPILSDNCYACHGPDSSNQKSDLRVDTFEQATADLGGIRGISPGSLEESEVHRRIWLDRDDVDVMPPEDSNRTLSEAEKKLLDQWILEGAEYDQHWSFKIPTRPDVPRLPEDLERRSLGAIDHFILDRLHSEGLRPSPRADLETRLRRAALTLTGLPPTPSAMDAALSDPASVAYERFVDRLLDSKDYSERQALRWLDAARYADTDGYQNDAERRNWPWRDWVLKAYRDNMPFDQFTIEQLAGDLLPEASETQVLASAFNRNHRQNSEGGALAPEFFVENVIDRVETTSTVWLGLTMGCARCHDHKFDPISQREFFQMFGYFNNIGERGIGRGIQANPVRNLRSPLANPPERLLTELSDAQEARRDAGRSLETRFREWLESKDSEERPEPPKWVEAPTLERADVVGSEGELTQQPDGSWLFSGPDSGLLTYELSLRPTGEGAALTAIRIDAEPNEEFGAPRKLARSVNGNFVLTDARFAVGGEGAIPIARAEASFEQRGYPISNAIDQDPNATGWAVFEKDAGPETVSAVFVLESPRPISDSETLDIKLSFQSGFENHNIGQLRIYTSTSEIPLDPPESEAPAQVKSALEKPVDERSADDIQALKEYYRSIDAPLKQAERAVQAAESALERVGAGLEPVMVMSERDGERRPAYLLERGQYDAPDKSTELPRAVPEALFDGAPEEQPQDRLELARWIVSDRNPLTARVIVNRIWRDHFGTGLSKTVEDFGSQGEAPTHPKLLDWLAVEFMESGWDLKALHRLIVTSATFQQSSAISPELQSRDPQNRLLARGPRYRLDGFSIRDLALQASGLLDDQFGGAPVKPYQPKGLWNAVAGRSNIRYQLSEESDLYRKSLYTYWKRAVNPPRQLIFDASGREACSVTVRRTNTPLQALTLMNDVTFLEAARRLAERAIQEFEDTDDRLASIYRRVTALTLDPERLSILRSSLDYFSAHFREQPGAASEFLKVGTSSSAASISEPERAAWTAIAHLVLNMDSAITLQ